MFIKVKMLVQFTVFLIIITSAFNECFAQTPNLSCFEKHAQYILVGYGRTIIETPDVSGCMIECLTCETTHGHACTSIVYFPDYKSCALIDENRFTKPDVFTPVPITEDTVDYYDNFCLKATTIMSTTTTSLLTSTTTTPLPTSSSTTTVTTTTTPLPTSTTITTPLPTLSSTTTTTSLPTTTTNTPLPTLSSTTSVTTTTTPLPTSTTTTPLQTSSSTTTTTSLPTTTTTTPLPTSSSTTTVTTTTTPLPTSTTITTPSPTSSSTTQLPTPSSSSTTQLPTPPSSLSSTITTTTPLPTSTTTLFPTSPNVPTTETANAQCTSSVDFSIKCSQNFGIYWDGMCYVQSASPATNCSSINNGKPGIIRNINFVDYTINIMKSQGFNGNLTFYIGSPANGNTYAMLNGQTSSNGNIMNVNIGNGQCTVLEWNGGSAYTIYDTNNCNNSWPWLCEIGPVFVQKGCDQSPIWTSCSLGLTEVVSTAEDCCMKCASKVWCTGVNYYQAANVSANACILSTENPTPSFFCNLGWSYFERK